MERKFYTNDFEQLLKENADQFKMSPSKKVWHGIYNDIHPGRRWPSIAMSLIFVFTLILVGHLNIQQSQHKNNYIVNVPKSGDVQKNKNVSSLGGNENKNTATTSLNKTISPSFHQIYQLPKDGVDQKVFEQNLNLSLDNTSKQNSTLFADKASKQNAVARAEKVNSLIKGNNNKKLKNTYPNANSPVVVNDNNFAITDYKDLSTKGNNRFITNDIVNENDIKSVFSNTPAKLNTAESLNAGNAIYPEVTSYVSAVISDVPVKNTSINRDGFSRYIENKPIVVSHKVYKNPKISWVYYLSPSISYRVYSKQGNPQDQLLLGYTSSLNSANLNKDVTHTPSIGMEGGTAFKYDLTKKLKFTFGLQVNYDAYTIQANNIHPVIAAVVLHNQKTGMPYSFTSIAYFGNGPGNIPVDLHNYSIQMSIPLGLEYQFAGNDRIQFSAAASFQPSLVLANQSYLLSTDRRNYITEASLGRIWNSATNFGTFISFHSNKFKWEIGPQVHYQLLSSYKNEYQVREHNIDYGIRIGISRLVR